MRRRRWGTPTDASAVMIALRPLVVRDAQQWWNWLASPFFDFVLPRFTRCSSATPTINSVPCCMILDSIAWWQTWPNHDNLQSLTVDCKSSWCPFVRYIMNCYIRLLSGSHVGLRCFIIYYISCLFMLIYDVIVFRAARFESARCTNSSCRRSPFLVWCPPFLSFWSRAWP